MNYQHALFKATVLYIFSRGDRNFPNSLSNSENLTYHLWHLSHDTLNNLQMSAVMLFLPAKKMDGAKIS